MRLAFLVVHSCPLGQPGSKNNGGMNVYVREMATTLGKMGHHVDIYTRAHHTGEATEVDFAQGTRVIHITDGHIIETDKLKMFHNLPRFIHNLENFRVSNDLHYDMIFSHYYISGTAGLKLQSSWKVPHLMTFHTLATVKNKIAALEKEPEFRDAAEREIATGCDRIIATTIAEKQIISYEFNVNRRKIAVVPCGVNTRLFHIMNQALCRRHLDINLDGKYILFTGRLDNIKGIDRLLGAIALLKKRTNLKLLVVGGDDGEPEKLNRLIELTKQMGIDKLVEFRGAVPQEELLYYYNAVDLFVMPSWSESFGMAALEALACGTPVVASHVGALPEIVRERLSGYVVDENTPKLLSAAIVKVIDNLPDFEPKLIRKSVLKYRWANVARALIKESRKLGA